MIDEVVICGKSSLYSLFFLIFCQNLPHDAYKLLAVPSPIGGVLVISANSIHYHSQVNYFLLRVEF